MRSICNLQIEKMFNIKSFFSGKSGSSTDVGFKCCIITYNFLEYLFRNTKRCMAISLFLIDVHAKVLQMRVMCVIFRKFIIHETKKDLLIYTIHLGSIV